MIWWTQILWPTEMIVVLHNTRRAQFVISQKVVLASDTAAAYNGCWRCCVTRSRRLRLLAVLLIDRRIKVERDVNRRLLLHIVIVYFCLVCKCNHPCIWPSFSCDAFTPSYVARFWRYSTQTTHLAVILPIFTLFKHLKTLENQKKSQNWRE